MADLSMIVRMVIYKCRELNNPVTETLAAYVAQTTLNGRKYPLWQVEHRINLMKKIARLNTSD